MKNTALFQKNRQKSRLILTCSTINLCKIFIDLYSLNPNEMEGIKEKLFNFSVLEASE